MSKCRLILRWVTLLLLLAGCSGKYGTFDVRGTVLLDGQPLPGATVLFMPEDGGGRAASGMTDSEGNFLLTTYKENDGALRGKYRVLVSKSEAIEPPPAHLKPGDEKSVTDHYRSLKSRQNRKSNVPRLYSRQTSSPLGCTVPTADKVVFELSSKDAK